MDLRLLLLLLLRIDSRVVLRIDSKEEAMYCYESMETCSSRIIRMEGGLMELVG